MKNSKVLSLIGLATKAGKTVSGEFSTEKSVKTGKGFLALVADDASENTKKKFRNMCTYYEVPLYLLSDKESLGRAMGKEFRASLAVQDENFAKAIIKELEKDPLLMDVLGPHLGKNYVHSKKMEWADYCWQVSEWEIEKYLYKI